MDYAKAPTDNLYKFVSIAGITLVVISVVFPARFWHDVELQRFELDAEIMTLRAEMDYWERRSVKLETEIDSVHTQLNGLPKDAEVREDAAVGIQTKMKTKLQELRTEFDHRGLEMGKNRAIQEAKDNQLKYLDSWARFLTIASTAPILGGSLLAGLGFFLWYSRLQRFQDQVLRRQAEESETS